MIYVAVLGPQNQPPSDWFLTLEENEIEIATNNLEQYQLITEWLQGIVFQSQNDFCNDFGCEFEYWHIFISEKNLPPKMLKSLLKKHPPVKCALESLIDWVNLPF